MRIEIRSGIQFCSVITEISFNPEDIPQYCSHINIGLNKKYYNFVLQTHCK